MAIPVTLVLAAALYAMVRPRTSYEVGAVLGSVLFPTVIGAVVAGFSARSASTAWSRLRYAGTVTGVALVLLLLRLLGGAVEQVG